MGSAAAIWQAICLLVKYLPALIDAVQRGEEFFEVKIALRTMDKAEEKADATKNTADLEAIFNPPPKPSGPPPGEHH